MDLNEKTTTNETTEKEKPTALETATKWYSRWLKLPLILFISIVAIFFIWGIVDPCVFHWGGDASGIMHLSNGFLCWFIWQIIGVLIGAIFYVGAKLITAPIVLQTEYLKKISEKE